MEQAQGARVIGSWSIIREDSPENMWYIWIILMHLLKFSFFEKLYMISFTRNFKNKNIKLEQKKSEADVWTDSNPSMHTSQVPDNSHEDGVSALRDSLCLFAIFKSPRGSHGHRLLFWFLIRTLTAEESQIKLYLFFLGLLSGMGSIAKFRH